MTNRMESLQQRLSQWGIDALLIENPIDLFYLTGLHVSRGRLIIYPEKTELWVDGRYFTYASAHANTLVRLWEKKTDLPVGQVGFDSAATTVAALEKLSLEQKGAIWKPIAKPLKEMRVIKEEQELASLRMAAELTWNGIMHMKSCLKVGIRERDVAWEFEQFVRQRGASALSFEPIVAFGENSALPHHRAGESRLEPGQIVLIDVGAVVDHYAGDATRVYFFGEVDPELKKLYSWVYRAYMAARQSVRIKEAVQQVDRAAREVFEQEGVEHLFLHSLGHGIGLETHEFPILRCDGVDANILLEKQMVFTLEPGLYLPKKGGVRLEDTGVVEETGFVSFYPELEENPLIHISSG